MVYTKNRSTVIDKKSYGYKKNYASNMVLDKNSSVEYGYTEKFIYRVWLYTKNHSTNMVTDKKSYSSKQKIVLLICL